MAHLNKFMTIARLTGDPEESRAMDNGTRVIKFRIAAGRSRKNAQGQWENDPKPLYLDCEAFAYPDAKRNLVNLVEQYVKKGDSVYLEGRLAFDQWEDKNGGGMRSKHKLIVENIEFISSSKGDEASGATQAEPAKAPATASAKGGKGKGGKTKAAPSGDNEPLPDANTIPF